MISVEEALDKILANIRVLDTEKKPILESLGQVLAEDVYSGIDIPPMDTSEMDGYAVDAADTKEASKKLPRILKVIDTVPAGTMPKHSVTPDTAIRIMTGAPIPKGANSVVKFEDTDENERGKDDGKIGIVREVHPGEKIRIAGEDISEGSLVLSRGTVIKPAHVGVFASIGKESVLVIRRPKIAILATGNELVEVGKPLPSGKLYNSNSYSVAAEVLHYGGIPWILGIALDREDSLVNKIHQGLTADMLITTGGVSKGDYDLVKDILAKEGHITFSTVRMRPGKPIAFGTFPSGRTNIPHLGLPGNPVSTMVTFEMFARPCIFKMMGKTHYDKPTIQAIIGDRIENEDGRRLFTRAVVEKCDGQYFARTTGPQGSHILTSMSLANGLVIVPEDKPLVNPGEKVNVLMLDWCGEEI
jgi:molybdopterin molybdotransferase